MRSPRTAAWHRSMSVDAHEKREALFSTIIISFTSTVADRRHKNTSPTLFQIPPEHCKSRQVTRQIHH
jgi:hypothetical protein